MTFQIELLERRALLTYVWDATEVNTTDPTDASLTASAILDSGSLVEVLDLQAGQADGARSVVSLISQGGAQHTRLPHSIEWMSFNGPGTGAAFGDFYAVAESTVDRGFALFRPGAGHPYSVLVQDADAPDVTALSAGVPSGVGHEVRVSVLFSDDKLLDPDSFTDENEIFVKRSDGTVIGPDRLELLGVVQGSHEVVATYAFSATADVFRVFVTDDAIRDIAGNSAGERLLTSIQVLPTGDGSYYSQSWTAPSPPSEPIPRAWSLYPTASLLDSPIAGAQLLTESGSLRIAAVDVASGDPIVGVWNGSGAAAWYPSTSQTQLLHATDSGMLAVQAQDALHNTLLYSPGLPAPLTPALGQDQQDVMYVVSARLSPDGRLLTFAARRSDELFAPPAIFTAIQASNALWSATIAVGAYGDGDFDDPGETRIEWGEYASSHGGEESEEYATLGLFPVADWGGRVSLGISLTGGDAGQSASVYRVVYLSASQGGLTGDGIQRRAVQAVDVRVTWGAGGIAHSSVASLPELVAFTDIAIFGGDEMVNGLQTGAETPGRTEIALPGPFRSLMLPDRAASADGDIGLVLLRQPDLFSIERVWGTATTLGLRPLLLVPGILGTMPTNAEFSEWLKTRGVHPESLRIDPLAGTYDGVIEILTSATVGYELFDPRNPRPSATLYVANYDWRMPPAPVNELDVSDQTLWRRTLDGKASGFTLGSLFDDVYAHGVDYLAFWLRQASDMWALAHGGKSLNSVDMYVHSTGMLVARAYIQSDAYHARHNSVRLPAVNRLLAVATPNLGASKPWNILHNDLKGEREYRLFVAPLLAAAFSKVESGGVIAGPDYNITAETVTSVLARNGTADGLRNRSEAFISLYCPTLRSLLATYPFLSSDGEHGLHQAPEARANLLMQDLNQEVDLAGPPWDTTNYIERVQGRPQDEDAFDVLVKHGVVLAAIASSGYPTVTYAIQQPSAQALTYLDEPYVRLEDTWSLYGPVVFDAYAATLGEAWWKDESYQRDGDKTVPLVSSYGIWENHPWVRRYLLGAGDGVRDDGRIDHGEINFDPASLFRVLQELGVPLSVDDIDPTPSNKWGQAFDGASALFSFWIDPVGAIVVDALGRRTGWSPTEGSLAEIPGSFVLGEEDALIWIPAESQLATLTLTGIEPSYAVGVSGPGVGAQWSGGIGHGESIELDLAFLNRVNAHASPGAVVSGAAHAQGTLIVGTLGADGHPIVFEQQPDGTWSVRALSLDGGDTEVLTDVETWTDPKDGRGYLGVATSRGLLVFSQSNEGLWSLQNLNALIPGAERIVDKLTSFVSIGGMVHIAGVSSGGDLLLFNQVRNASSQGGWHWEAANLSVTDLAAQGVSTPHFVGRLTSFVTAWNALNIVGLDEEGRLQVVWIAGRATRWTLSSLSMITQAPVMVGDVSVFLTSWNAINIAATDTRGNMVATWWVPSFGADWATSDLTSLFGGPRLSTGTVYAFTTPWNALNIVGVAEDSGEVVAYWWHPAGADDEGRNPWRVSSLSDVAGDEGNRASAPVRGLGTQKPVGLHLFSLDDSSEIVHYWWTPVNGNWAVESLTAVATQ